MLHEEALTTLRRRAKKYIKSGNFDKLKNDIKEDVVLAVLIEGAIAVGQESAGADRARFVKLATELVGMLEGGKRKSDDLEGVVR